jgi:hypothetical protein
MQSPYCVLATAFIFEAFVPYRHHQSQMQSSVLIDENPHSIGSSLRLQSMWAGFLVSQKLQASAPRGSFGNDAEAVDDMEATHL